MGWVVVVVVVVVVSTNVVSTGSSVVGICSVWVLSLFEVSLDVGDELDAGEALDELVEASDEFRLSCLMGLLDFVESVVVIPFVRRLMFG